MVRRAAHMAIDFRTTSHPASYGYPSCITAYEIFECTTDLSHHIWIYSSYDLSLSFSFLSLVNAAPIVHFAIQNLQKSAPPSRNVQPDSLVGSHSFPPRIPQCTNTDDTNSQCTPPPSASRAHLVTNRALSFKSTARRPYPLTSPSQISSPLSIARSGLLFRHVALCAPRRNSSTHHIANHPIRSTPAQSSRCTEVPFPHNWSVEIWRPWKEKDGRSGAKI